jgi:hypothetical protein
MRNAVALIISNGKERSGLLSLQRKKCPLIISVFVKKVQVLKLLHSAECNDRTAAIKFTEIKNNCC